MHTAVPAGDSRNLAPRPGLGESLSGTRLSEVQIAEQFGVTRTPVWEALGQLELAGPVRRLRRIAEHPPGRMQASYELARDIVIAIASGYPDLAERAMRAQLITARDAVSAVPAREKSHMGRGA